MSLSESEGKTVVSRATGSTPSHHISGQDTAGKKRSTMEDFVNEKMAHNNNNNNLDSVSL